MHFFSLDSGMVKSGLLAFVGVKIQGYTNGGTLYGEIREFLCRSYTYAAENISFEVEL